MDTQPLKLQVDSKQAQADLAALARALESAGSAAMKMKTSFATGMSGADAAIKGAMGSMEKFATVANLLNKIKVDGAGTKSVVEFAKAMSQVARAKEIEKSKLDSYRRFIEVGMLVSRLKISGNAFAGIQAFTAAIDAAAKTRQVTPAKLKSWVDFIDVAARVQRLRFSPQTATSLTSFAAAMDAVARTRGITAAKVSALRDFFAVLGSLKPMRYAESIAKDLDHLASAAARAGAAMASMPRANALGSAASNTAGGVKRFNDQLKMTPAIAERANGSFSLLHTGLEKLNNRFSLSYQAGTLFTSMFASFTVGGFVKGIYDTTIEALKLDKAMLFLTGTFEGAKEASNEYLAIADRLGMRALENASAYSRFAISSKAIGATQEEVNKIFESTGLALSSVGASGQQWEYAFYGLSQAMAKGKISSEEFNRQIGEQIPGNVAAGVKALSTLEGKQLTANDLFDRMKQGAIQSLPFLKEWANEINKMFSPLLPMAEKRPDFQLARLMNVFDRFKLSIGSNGFIGELTTQFKRLSDMFIVGEGKAARLNEQGENLAQTLGRNLGDVVRGLGDGLAWLAQNIDTVLAGIKGLLALTVVATLNGWATSLAKYTEKQIAATVANFKRADSEKAVAGATASATAATATSANATTAKTAATMGAATSKSGGFSPWVFNGPAPAGAFGRKQYTPGGPFDATTGRRGQVQGVLATPFGSGRDVNRPGLVSRIASGAGGVALSAATTAASAGAKAATTAFKGLRFALGAMPGIAMAAAVALAVFGEELSGLKTEAGNDIKVKDIASGAFDEIIGGVSASMKEAAVGFEALFGAASGSISGKSLGDWLIWIAAGFITVGKALFTVAETIGKVLGTLIAGMIKDAMMWGQVVGRIIKGDFVGAGKIMAARAQEKVSDVTDLGKEIAGDFKDAFDINAVVERITNGAARAADKRSGATEASAQSAAADASIQAALKQREAADAQAKAAADLSAAARDFKGDVVPNYDAIRGDIVALMEGKAFADAKPADATKPAPAAKPAATAATGVKVVADEGLNKNLYNTAFAMKGLREDQDGKALSGLFSGAGIAMDPAKQAWCAAFVSAVLAAQGVKQSAAPVRASSYKDWGQAVGQGEAKQGDVVVLKPQTQGGAGSGHVGFFEGYNKDGSVRVLGGNQGGAKQGGGGVTSANFKASDVVAIRRAEGVTTAATGTPTGMADEGKYESDVERRQNSYRQFQSILAEADAAEAARSALVSKTEALGDIIQKEKDLRNKAQESGAEYKSFITPEQLTLLDKAFDKMKQDLTDAINPLGKMNREMEASLKVTELSAKGRADEARWQEILNEQIENRVDLSRIDMEAEKKRFMAGEARKRQLATEIELVRTLNDITVEQIGRTGTRRDATLAGLIAAKSTDGESYADTRARLERDGSMGTINKQANAIDAQASLGAQQDILRDLVEMQAMSGLGGRARTQRADFKSYLEEITGMTGTLDELIANSSTDAQALARRAAEIKDAFENPPGFQRWANSLDPLSERLEQIKGDFMDGLGSGITDALMGEDVNWGDIARDLSKKVLRAQVDNALQGIVGMFGGKAKGATPEAQALIDVSAQMKSAADVAAQTTTQATVAAADTLTTSAGNLTTAATDLSNAAAALATGSTGTMEAGDIAMALGNGAADPAGADIARKVLQPMLGDGGFTAEDLQLALENRASDPAAAAMAEQVIAGAMSATDALTASTDANTAALNAVTTSLPAISSAMPNGVDPIGDLLGASAPSVAATGDTGSQGMSGLFKSIGPAIQLAVTAGLNKMPKNFESSSEFGNSLSLTPGQTSGSKLAGLTSMLKSASTGGFGGGAGGGIGGFFKGLFGGGAGASGMLSGGMGSDTLSGGSGMDMLGAAGGGMGNMFSGIFGKGQDGQYNGAGGFLGQLFGAGNSMETRGAGAMGALGFAAPLLAMLKKKKKPEEALDPIKGVIGEHRGVNVTGTAIAGHSNPIADLLNVGLNMFGGGMGGMFKEGGFSNAPVQKTHLSSNINWSKVPHYSEGTANTSGGMPAMLHPNEAVIPLSRGRSIPVDLGGAASGGGSSQTVNTNITVVAPNPDGFRKAQGSIQRQTNRDMKRAAVRNLSPH